MYVFVAKRAYINSNSLSNTQSEKVRRITDRSRLMAGPGYGYFIVAFCIGAMDL